MSKRTDQELSPRAVRQMYARAMAQWALETMDLRRSGLHIPSSRPGSESPASPSLGGPRWFCRYEIGTGARDLLAWRPAVRKAA